MRSFRKSHLCSRPYNFASFSRRNATRRCSQWSSKELLNIKISSKYTNTKNSFPLWTPYSSTSEMRLAHLSNQMAWQWIPNVPNWSWKQFYILSHQPQQSDDNQMLNPIYWILGLDPICPIIDRSVAVGIDPWQSVCLVLSSPCTSSISHPF